MNKSDIILEVSSLIGRFAKPVVVESKSEYKKFPAFLDLKLDAAFLSRSEDIETRDYKEMVSVARSLGIDKSIDTQEGVRKLVDLMQTLQRDSISDRPTVDLVRRARLMRLLYSLVNSASPSSAGVLFERLFALLFDMKVETSTSDNLKDVFGKSGKSLSLKLIDKKTRITGSTKLLADAGGTIEYLVARKEGPSRLLFYNILIAIDDSGDDSLGQFDLSYYAAAEKDEVVSKDGVSLFAQKIGALDISEMPAISKKIGQVVNQRFNDLIKETEELVDAVRDLVETDEGKTSKAKKAEDRATKAKEAAKKIQQQK